MNGYRNASYMGFVLVLIGLVVAAYGLYNLTIEWDLDKKGLKTQGEVFELEAIPPYNRAWVMFTTKSGETVRFLDKLYWNKYFNTYTIGQKVEVIYDPADPIQTATINDFFQRNTAPWFPVILGGIVALVGILMRRMLLRKAKRLDEQMSRYS